MVHCPDQPGIVAAISGFLFARGANITHSDQHSTDPSGGRFFLRVEFALSGLADKLPGIRHAFQAIESRFGLITRWALASDLQRLAIFVSHDDHCLQELLWAQRSGDLRATIALVIGNHPDLASVVEPWDIPFSFVGLSSETKVSAEATQLAMLNEANIDLVVLARYMQVLSADFVQSWAGKIINIHHSFLPAFAGARPFQQAHARGVKLIGATAHYVTEELDAGPIIEQDVQRVDHRNSVAELRRISRQIERSVLARAVSWHVDDRVIIDGNKTVVFGG